jgi:2-polyprenyl-3-methyl-5-hydroxy-6-metoxy-1,4-benzoquinol methylase
MMFGFGEYFDYVECSNCGCLQIKYIPEKMEKYYPNKSYYSFKKRKNLLAPLKKIMINHINRYCLFGNDPFGKLVNIKYSNPFFSILGKLNLNYNSKILDVGCGAGLSLHQLKDLNFEHLLGVDPYLNSETHNGSLNILKKSIYYIDNNQKFDLILFSHSFEHLEDPFKILKKVRNILSENGVCIIRMPVKTNYIWSLYGVHWAQIDAPRHFFIQTTNSFKILLKKSNLKLEEVIFDSYELQFWCSEQYKKNIPFKADNSYSQSRKKSIFTKSQINEFKKRSKELNNINSGDQATFIIKK